MQFSTLFLTALASMQAVYCESSEQFGLLTIRSGSNLQYASVYAEGDTLYFGSSNDALDAEVTDCGLLKLSDQKYAYIDKDGTVKQGCSDDASSGFAIKNGHLAFNDSEGFFAVPTDGKYKVSEKSVDSAVGVAIRAQSLKGGNTVPDYTPEGKNC
ncbi:related to CWP1-Cell wall mannoprotein [Zygosaccharomyces bailii ISA1307]|nr:related to CWP1-Cell wall mannoprotein [Zygosaccharomyces bailii ISA1307]